MLEKNLKFDKRIIDRNIKRGTTTKEEYDNHMAGLNDVADNAEDVEVDVQEGEFVVDFPEPMEDEDEE